MLDIFLIFAQNIDCGYTLEPPRRSGSNEYPQCMFWMKNNKIRYTPSNPSFFFYIKVGFKGVYIARTCFPDVTDGINDIYFLWIRNSNTHMLHHFSCIFYDASFNNYCHMLSINKQPIKVSKGMILSPKYISINSFIMY